MIAYYLHDVYALFKYYRMRFIFSLVGIMVGVGAICALIALNSIVKKNSQEFIKKFGGSQFVLNIMPANARDQKIANDYLSFQNMSDFIAPYHDEFTLIPYKLISAKTRYHEKLIEAVAVAATSEIFTFMQWQVEEGRKLHPLDKNDKVMVIGAKVAKKLRNMGLDQILGQELNMDGHYFTVVGILQEKEFNPVLDFDINNTLLMDVNLLGRFENCQIIDSFIVKGNKGDLLSSENHLKERIERDLGGMRTFVKDALMFEQALFKQVALTMNILAIVAALTLFLGIVSMVNLLFILIEERKKEIGLRLSIGATTQDIGLQFLVETLCLCLIGGGVGIVLAQLLSYVIALKLNLVYYSQASSWVLGILVTVLIGLVVGLIPARMARRFDPVKLINS
ncbi:MAG: ABC transporter permease [Proteobacteria bacterium]|nr:ABC transporter permease [Pseudomonadota bacterium]